MTRHKKHRPTLRSLYLWHRYLGLAVALLAVLLAITGVMLNHTDQLGLAQRQVNKPWLLKWYGITPPKSQFYRVSEHWLSQWGNHLYLDQHELPFTQASKLQGAVALEEMLVAAGSDSLLLLTPDGQLIERLDSLDGVPGDIRAIAAGGSNRIILQTGNGAVSGDLLSGTWEEVTVSPHWSKPAIPPETLHNALLARHPGAKLPLERIILDLHSGRLFGDVGIYIMDAAAVLLLFNAASGVIIWWRRRRQQRERAQR